MVLSETGSDHLWSLPKEVSRVAELCVGQGNPTRFRGVRVVAIKTGAFDLDATAVRCRCQAKVVDRIAKCYACFIFTSVPPRNGRSMSSNPRLDEALMVLRDAGHRIGDVHIPPPAQALAMHIWIDRISCTFEGVLKMAEEERKESKQRK